MSKPVMWIVLLGWILTGCEVDDGSAAGDSEPPEPTVVVSDECASAFERAAEISDFQRTNDDLFPAYRACSDVDEWRAADAMFPGVLRGVDPVLYAMNGCAGNAARLGSSPICQAVNEPEELGADVITLQASDDTGLLGVRLPAGSDLEEETAGDPELMRDPQQRYSIDASREEIVSFFDRTMRDDGWLKQGTSTETAHFFVRGELMLGVLVNREGGRFTLMGS